MVVRAGIDLDVATIECAGRNLQRSGNAAFGEFLNRPLGHIAVTIRQEGFVKLGGNAGEILHFVWWRLPIGWKLGWCVQTQRYQVGQRRSAGEFHRVDPLVQG